MQAGISKEKKEHLRYVSSKPSRQIYEENNNRQPQQEHISSVYNAAATDYKYIPKRIYSIYFYNIYLVGW